MRGTKLHRGVALIEVREPHLLAEIESDPVLSPFLGDRISSCCIAVQPQAVPEVLRRLRSLGHLPQLVGDRKES